MYNMCATLNAPESPYLLAKLHMEGRSTRCSKLGTLRRRQGDSSAEPHRKIGERSLEILESAIDREDLLVDCAPLRDGGGIEGADGRPSTCVEINRCGSGARRAELHATPSSVGGVAVEKVFRTDACASVQRASGHAVRRGASRPTAFSRIPGWRRITS